MLSRLQPLGLGNYAKGTTKFFHRYQGEDESPCCFVVARSTLPERLTGGTDLGPEVARGFFAK
jgi:hypothetical protein